MAARRTVLAALLWVAAACTLPREGAPRAEGSSAASAPTAIDSMLVRADSFYYDASEPDSAAVLYRQALDRADGEADSASRARALTGLGQVARLRGDFAESRRLGEDAVALKQRLGLQNELFRSYNTLGLLAWDEERLADASKLLQQAAAAARAQGDSVAIGKAMVNTGLVLDDLGDYDSARAALVSGRDASRAAADSATLGKALTDIASLDSRLGDPLSALASLEVSLGIARSIGDALNEANALGQLAVAYDAVGEPQRAFAALDSAIDVARRHDLTVEVDDDLKLRADLYAGAGDYRRALDGYAAAAAFEDSLGRREEQGDALRNEGRVQFTVGRPDLALQRANAALQLHRAGGFRSAELGDLVLLAELDQAAGRSGLAEEALRSARTIASELRVGVALAQVALGEARVADRAGDAGRVLRTLEAARASVDLAGDAAKAEALALCARAYAKLGQLNGAATAGRQAMAAVERVRGNYASDALRTAYTSDRISVYVDLVVTLLRLGRTDEALEVADRARGRALLEHLAVERAGVAAAPPGRALAEGDRLLRAIDELTARLQSLERRNPRERTAVAVANEQDVAERLTRARSEYEALLARTARLDSASLLLLGAGVTRAGDVRASLLPGEVLLEYFVTPERLLIFLADGTGVMDVESRITAEDLSARVRLARALLAKRDADAAQARVLQSLYDVLLRPVMRSGRLQHAKRLVIVPHAALTYLPFAALVDSASGHQLVQDFSLLVMPSAGSLEALRRRRGRDGAATSVSAAAFAPFPSQLPATKRETEGVGQILGGAALFIGAAASEARLRRELEAGAIVHVATHGEMNARNPLFSRLDLAPGKGGAWSDDGKLEAHEVLGLRAPSPLVFLSGCETGLGAAWSTPFEVGEDYTTLAQSLLYAGARNVVATLWRIDDVAAAEFAERFYVGLRTQSVPEALAQAQRELLSDPRYRNPYFWAAYEASGDGARIPAMQRTDAETRRPAKAADASVEP